MARTLKLSPPSCYAMCVFFREVEENPQAPTAAFEPKSKGTANQLRYVVTWFLEINTHARPQCTSLREFVGKQNMALAQSLKLSGDTKGNKKTVSESALCKLQAHPPSSSRTASHGNYLTDQPTLTHANLIVNHVYQVDAHVLMARPMSPISDIKIIRPGPLRRILQIQSRWSAGAMVVCVCVSASNILKFLTSYSTRLLET